MTEELEPNYQAIRAAEKYIKYCEQKAEVTWRHGPSGTGKTNLAQEITSEAR
jgi:DNA replication protein DnaC